MVIYDSKRLIPAPFVSVVKEFQTTEDGQIVGTLFTITLKGTLVADKGSPKTNGTFHTTSGYPADESIVHDARLGALLRKMEALRHLFATEGLTLEVQSMDGSTPMKCNPRVKRLDFPEGGQGRISWVDKADYIIQLEADVLYGLYRDASGNSIAAEDIGDPVNYKVSKATEEWTMEVADERSRTQRLTHTVSATGKRFYKEDGTLELYGWEQARKYVLNKLGLGLVPARMEAPGVLDASTVQGFNYIRSQHVGELSGIFSVTETWLCYDPAGGAAAVDDYQINVRTAQDGRVTVSIDGTITGVEVRDNNTQAIISSKYANAYSKWTTDVSPNLYARALAAAGVTLHTVAVSSSFGLNETAGTITYQVEFDDRANTDTSGAISETVEVINNHQADIYASIPVLGRAAGPVLQDIGTNTAKKRVIQIEVVMRAKSQSFTPTVPNTNAIVTALTPAGTVFMDQNEERWNYNTGRYSRTVAFTWE